MDMSKSSEARIKEAVNILKIIEQFNEDRNYEKRDFINYSVLIKLKNPHMLWADEDEILFVPHMLTHQEYKYMSEHIEELMSEETSEEQNPVVPIPGGEYVGDTPKS